MPAARSAGPPRCGLVDGREPRRGGRSAERLRVATCAKSCMRVPKDAMHATCLFDLLGRRSAALSPIATARAAASSMAWRSRPTPSARASGFRMQGEERVSRWESSPGFFRRFCRRCGSVVPGDPDSGHRLRAGGKLRRRSRPAAAASHLRGVEGAVVRDPRRAAALRCLPARRRRRGAARSAPRARGHRGARQLRVRRGRLRVHGRRRFCVETATAAAVARPARPRTPRTWA